MTAMLKAIHAEDMRRRARQVVTKLREMRLDRGLSRSSRNFMKRQ